MAVHEANGGKVGVVRTVFLGAAADGTPVTAAEATIRRDSFIDDLAAALAPDQWPDEIRQLLRLSGFIRIDMTGMLRADHYAFPEQIASVEHERVTLRVSRDQLFAAAPHKET
jgi:hypothetical protein